MIEPALWQRMQRFSAGGSEGWRVIQEAKVVPVHPAAHVAAPVEPLVVALPLPPPGTLATQEVRLAAVRGGGHVVGVEWPVCCDRLAVLHFHNGAGETLDAALDAGILDDCLLREGAPAPSEDRAQWAEMMERVRKRKHSGEGMSVFRCAACGRLYGSWSMP